LANCPITCATFWYAGDPRNNPIESGDVISAYSVLDPGASSRSILGRPGVSIWHGRPRNSGPPARAPTAGRVLVRRRFVARHDRRHVRQGRVCVDLARRHDDSRRAPTSSLIRSMRCSVGRLLRRRRTLTWWRSTAFSMISARRERIASTATPTISLADFAAPAATTADPRAPRPTSGFESHSASPSPTWSTKRGSRWSHSRAPTPAMLPPRYAR
jgi:hypothetical protein